MRTNRRQFLRLGGGIALGAIVAPGLSQFGGYGVGAQPISGSPTFKGGAGKSVQGPVSLNAGVTVVRAQHNGAGNFSVTIFLPMPSTPGESLQQVADNVDYTDSSLIFDEIGAFKGAAVALTGVPGDHFMAVNSSGAFQLSVEQPLPETVTPVQQTDFSGKGKHVTPYFTLPPGISTLSVQTTSTNFRAWLWHLDDLGGAPVAGGANGYDGRFFDFTVPESQTAYAVSLPDAGPYLISTDNVSPTDTWTFTFQ